MAQQQTPQPASALVVARTPLGGARQLAPALAMKTSVETGPPLRLASLRTTPPHLTDQAQASPKGVGRSVRGKGAAVRQDQNQRAGGCVSDDLYPLQSPEYLAGAPAATGQSCEGAACKPCRTAAGDAPQHTTGTCARPNVKGSLIHECGEGAGVYSSRPTERSARATAISQRSRTQGPEPCHHSGWYAPESTGSRADCTCREPARRACEIASTGVCGFTWDSRAL